MKKLLLVLTVAAFVACNDSGTTEETPNTDSPAVTQPTQPMPDSTATATDSTGADSTMKK